MLRPVRLASAAFAVAVAGGAGVVEAQMPGQGPKPDKVPETVSAPAEPGPALAPASWIRPVPGTRAVYTTYATTVTRANGWRVEYMDDTKRPRALIAGIVRDSVGAPLVLNDRVFQDLWPLKVGQRVQFETQRFPTIWRWDVAVTTTERLTVEAGTFDCYVIDAVVSTLERGRRSPATDRILFWYAPSIGAIVRTYQRRDGVMNVAEGRIELARLERPGMPPVGVPAAAVPQTARGIPRPR